MIISIISTINHRIQPLFFRQLKAIPTRAPYAVLADSMGAPASLREDEDSKWHVDWHGIPEGETTEHLGLYLVVYPTDRGIVGPVHPGDFNGIFVGASRPRK